MLTIKKKIFATIAILAVIIIYFKKNNITINNNKKKIAIIYPLSCECINDQRDGFIEELSKHIDATYDIYDANSDKILLNSQVKQIINGNYDLVCAIATSPFITLVEQTAQKKSSLPIVGCSADATQLGYNSVDKNYIDVSDQHDSIDKVNKLIDLYNPTRIIIPYSSLPLLESQVNDIKTYAEKNNILVIPISIYNPHEIQIKIEHELYNSENERDVVLILGDCFMMLNVELVSSICLKYKKIFCTSDLESVNLGSTIGYGIKYKDCGMLAAQKAIEILLNNKKPSELENVVMKDIKLKINLDNPMHKELNLNLLNTKYKDQVIWYSKNENETSNQNKKENSQ
jgi:ABC-type uncharacterized transport system substrate-binding protein